MMRIFFLLIMLCCSTGVMAQQVYFGPLDPNYIRKVDSLAWSPILDKAINERVNAELYKQTAAFDRVLAIHEQTIATDANISSKLSFWLTLVGSALTLFTFFGGYWFSNQLKRLNEWQKEIEDTRKQIALDLKNVSEGQKEIVETRKRIDSDLDKIEETRRRIEIDLEKVDRRSEQIERPLQRLDSFSKRANAESLPIFEGNIFWPPSHLLDRHRSFFTQLNLVDVFEDIPDKYLFHFAMYLYQQGSTEEALEKIEAKKQPDSVDLLLKAVLLLRQDTNSLWKEAAMNALRLDPENIGALSLLYDKSENLDQMPDEHRCSKWLKINDLEVAILDFLKEIGECERRIEDLQLELSSIPNPSFSDGGPNPSFHEGHARRQVEIPVQIRLIKEEAIAFERSISDLLNEISKVVDFGRSKDKFPCLNMLKPVYNYPLVLEKAKSVFSKDNKPLFEKLNH
jgi:tetratricopeptide (TPR) repeat protein